MSLVVGVDQSVNHTGVCVIDHDAVLIYSTLIEPPKKLKDGFRLAFIRDALNRILAQFPAVDVVVMEGYSHGSINKKFLLGEIGGIVKMAAADADADLYIAAPKQRAKFATGHGSADKKDVIKAVKNKWGEEITDDNVADAYVLARIGHEILYQTSRRRYELETVKSIEKNRLKSPQRRSIKRALDSI